LFDLQHEQCVIKFGIGPQSTSTVAGKWSGYITDNGEQKKIILDEVAVVPGSAYNLFSLTRILSRGSLKSYGQEMVLECKGVTIRFNHRVETANSFLLAAKFEPDVKKEHLGCMSMNVGSTIRAVDLHARLVHKRSSDCDTREKDDTEDDHDGCAPISPLENGEEDKRNIFKAEKTEIEDDKGKADHEANETDPQEGWHTVKVGRD
jgi:hypothetical protein